MNIIRAQKVSDIVKHSVCLIKCKKLNLKSFRRCALVTCYNGKLYVSTIEYWPKFIRPKIEYYKPEESKKISFIGQVEFPF